MKKLQKPPSDLSKPAKKLWKSIQSEFGILDTPGLMYLATACRHYDRMEQARQSIVKEGAVLVDRFGQKKPHPSAIIERDSSAAMLRAFRMLNLDVIPAFERAGRPPGK